MSGADEVQRRGSVGLTYGLLAYGFWGLSPLFWRLVAEVPVAELLAHRLAWGCLWFGAWLGLQGRLGELRSVFRQRRTLRRLSVSAILLATNWFVFVYAVLVHRVLDASLGYFINPMVSVALGRIVLAERLRPLQLASVTIAIGGIAVAASLAGGLPWISLVLALSFGIYGLLRKTIDVAPLAGSTAETVLLLPLGLGTIAWLALHGEGHFGTVGVGVDLLLVATGLVTALPLLWFVNAARRLRLVTVGFLQFLAPSLQFVLATVAFDEPLEPGRLLSFALVWLAIAVFSIDAVRHRPPKAG